MTNLREYVACNLCSSTDHRHYASGRNRLWPSEVFQVVRCNQCGLVFLNPRPVEMESGLRDRPFDPGLLPQPAEQALWQARFAEWSCLVQPFACGRSLLDFGCGMGSFWNAARREGWDAYGCDIGTALIAAAREFWKTDRLFAATAAELVQRHPGYFDVVNSSQVFEHLCDPKRTAQELHTILKPGGVLALDVPNLGTWGERVRKGFVLDVPAHFTYFSPQSIRQLLESSGYQVLGVWSGSAAMRLVSRVVRDPNVAGRLAAGLRKVGRGSGAIQVVAKAGQPLAP